MVICDIDGLKLVNDTLGHSAGDALINKAASLIQSCFRETDIIARIGGDEFAVLLPNCSAQAVENACQRINDSVFEYNLLHSALPLSISVGCAIGSEQASDLGELFREADDNMYREKLLNSKAARHSLFQSILRDADTKDFRADGHNDRVKDLSEELANRLQLPKNRIATLRRLAQHHDIGKVCISDQILFKPGLLTQEERVKMQRHSDIGRRIAQSIPDLTDIADLIWKHHEWWDGNGYPLGLKHDEIPLECRILGIVEAYDAMTHNQPYRSALSPQAAKAELSRCSGSQFDPVLTTEFLAMLAEKPQADEAQAQQAN
jgi:diguanylate cyclase (GGDEF)-like protein